MSEMLMEKSLKSVKKEPIVQFSGSAFKHDPQYPNAEPECRVRFKEMLNLEPELGVQFGPVQYHTFSQEIRAIALEMRTLEASMRHSSGNYTPIDTNNASLGRSLARDLDGPLQWTPEIKAQIARWASAAVDIFFMGRKRNQINPSDLSEELTLTGVELAENRAPITASGDQAMTFDPNYTLFDIQSTLS
ncbi:hypothetical protein C8J57DRAFT_1238464 [Mycena rebaudengoi]|nr:hypothetical protein C8J57DRAFT_1238464 [Mycena rebaudengoi]